MENEIELVDDLDAVPVDEQGLAERAGEHLIKGELDVFARELVAVVEVDIVAQLDVDVQTVLADLVALGEVALDLAAVGPILENSGS